MMDEEITDTVPGSTTDPEPGSSGNKTIVKPKKKAAPAKKTVKEAAPAKTKNEAAQAKKVDKSAVPSKANKATELTNKTKEATHGQPPIEKKMAIIDLVCEAIAVLGEPRKGLSVQAIKKYIKSKQDFGESGFNARVNKAINKGIEKGILVRPHASKDVTGAVGYFRLAKVELPKRKIKGGRIDSEHASDSEATEKPVKPRKRNLSDTYIAEMVRASTPLPSMKEILTSKDKQTKKVPKKNVDNKKDTSDSKIVVKETERKSTKSYSSDTEVDIKNKITKTAKQPLKKAASDKTKADSAENKASKAKVKKLYNNNEGKGTKSGKTKTKKQA